VALGYPESGHQDPEGDGAWVPCQVGRARGSGQPTETPQLSDTAAHQQGLTHALALPVHLGKPEMPHGGWTETVDSTEIDLAATIQRIKDLAAAPH
jgi:hypothetical protein